MINYQPEGNKLLVKIEEIEEVTAGGIIKPQMVRDDEQLSCTTGEVLAVGPSVDMAFAKSRPVKIGDKVIFARYGGVLIDEREGLRIIHDEDVLAMIND